MNTANQIIGIFAGIFLIASATYIIFYKWHRDREVGTFEKMADEFAKFFPATIALVCGVMCLIGYCTNFVSAILISILPAFLVVYMVYRIITIRYPGAFKAPYDYSEIGM